MASNYHEELDQQILDIDHQQPANVAFAAVQPVLRFVNSIRHRGRRGRSIRRRSATLIWVISAMASNSTALTAAGACLMVAVLVNYRRSSKPLNRVPSSSPTRAIRFAFRWKKAQSGAQQSRPSTPQPTGFVFARIPASVESEVQQGLAPGSCEQSARSHQVNSPALKRSVNTTPASRDSSAAQASMRWSLAMRFLFRPRSRNSINR